MKHVKFVNALLAALVPSSYFFFFVCRQFYHLDDFFFPLSCLSLSLYVSRLAYSGLCAKCSFINANSFRIAYNSIGYFRQLSLANAYKFRAAKLVSHFLLCSVSYLESVKQSPLFNTICRKHGFESYY